MDRSGWRLTPTGATLVILLEAMCQSGSKFVLNLENYISQNILFNCSMISNFELDSPKTFQMDKY
jgi:hypothetical protein